MIWLHVNHTNFLLKPFWISPYVLGWHKFTRNSFERSLLCCDENPLYESLLSILNENLDLIRYCTMIPFLLVVCIILFIPKACKWCDFKLWYSLGKKWTWPLWYRYRFQDKDPLNTKWSKSVDLFLPGARFLKGDMRRKCCTERSKYLLYWIQHQQGRQRSFFLSQQHMAILQFE